MERQGEARARDRVAQIVGRALGDHVRHKLRGERSRARERSAGAPTRVADSEYGRRVHGRGLQEGAEPGDRGVAKVHAQLLLWRPDLEQRGREARRRQGRAAVQGARAAAHPVGKRARWLGDRAGRRGRAHVWIAPVGQRRAHARAVRRGIPGREPEHGGSNRPRGDLCGPAPGGKQRRKGKAGQRQAGVEGVPRAARAERAGVLWVQRGVRADARRAHAPEP